MAEQPLLPLLNVLLVTAFAFLVGCASPGTAGKTSAASKAGGVGTNTVAEQPFAAPNDPQMGQIVVAIPQVAVSAPVSGSAGNLGQLVRSQLAGCLSQSPNFQVADRETLVEIGQEQKLAESGATAPRERPARGPLAGPRYLIKADVTEFKEEAVGTSKAGRFELGAFAAIAGAVVPKEARLAMDIVKIANPTFGGGKEKVHGIVGIDIRIIDVDTAAVVRATRASSSLTRENSRVVLGVAGLSLTDSKFDQSVVAQAMRLAVQDAVLQIHSILRERTLVRAAAPLGAVSALSAEGALIQHARSQSPN